MGLMEGIRSMFGVSQKQAYMGSRRDASRYDLTEFSGWNPSLGFAGSDMSGEWDIITGRARDLDQNNGWVNAGIDRRVESVMGGQIRLSAQPQQELLNRDYDWRMGWTAEVQARFKSWSNDIEHRNDARQRLSFGAQAKLAYLTYVRDGEACAEIRDDARGIANTTNVLLIEPERVSQPANAAESQTLRRGIRYDKNGAPLGYYVRSGNQSDPAPDSQSLRWDYIPVRGKTGRAKFVHVYSLRRVEQNRGVSRLAEVMLPAKMLDRVDRAEVNAALKSAIFSLFVKSPGTTEDLEAALAPASDGPAIDPWIEQYLTERKNNPVRVEGAQVNHLLPNEDVVVPERSSPNSNYASFAQFILRKVAGSLGVATPQLSGDWSAINYSSARALLNEIWRSFLEDRHYFTQHFLTPIYAAWLELEVALGAVKIPGGPVNFYRNKTAICMAEWIGPGRGSVDPLKEANANNLDAAAGRASTVEHILERGRDPSDVLAEEAWWLEERKKRGLEAPNYNTKAAADAAAAQDENPPASAADGSGDKQKDQVA
jgi:lambda family phage portal protein